MQFLTGSCRRTKGIGIFKLHAEKDEKYKIRRENWLSELTKTRVLDADFKRQIQNDTVYTCKKHFRPEDIEICKYSYICKLLDNVCSYNIRGLK